MTAVPIESSYLAEAENTLSALSSLQSTTTDMSVNPLLSETASTTLSLSLDNLSNVHISTKYAFMLPTSILVATCCQLAGIGGAALFSPIFLLIFPLLGPQYPLPSSLSAIAAALLNETFGFASGLTGYARRGLVDWKIAAQFLVVAVPASLLGALVAKVLAQNIMALRVVYAVFMLGLAGYLIWSPRPEALEDLATQADDEGCEIPNTTNDDDNNEEEEEVDEDGNLISSNDGLVRNTAADGRTYVYLAPPKGSLQSTSATVAGATLTGLLGVGIGEVILPQLVRTCCMPLPMAAGTSVSVVVATVATAALIQFIALAQDTGGNLLSVVPWDLVAYTIPGVLLGGQLAPYLASQGQFKDEDIERFAAVLFAVVGLAFGIKAVVG